MKNAEAEICWLTIIVTIVILVIGAMIVSLVYPNLIIADGTHARIDGGNIHMLPDDVSGIHLYNIDVTNLDSTSYIEIRCFDSIVIDSVGSFKNNCVRVYPNPLAYNMRIVQSRGEKIVRELERIGREFDSLGIVLNTIEKVLK